jgi:hypothetical protein
MVEQIVSEPEFLLKTDELCKAILAADSRISGCERTILVTVSYQTNTADFFSDYFINHGDIFNQIPTKEAEAKVEKWRSTSIGDRDSFSLLDGSKEDIATYVAKLVMDANEPPAEEF